MPFRSVAEYAGSTEDVGSVHYGCLFKTGTPSNGTATRMADTSMSPGTPLYNPYAGVALTSTPLTNLYGNRGINTGPLPGPGKTKHLHTLQWYATAGVAATAVLADYLMYYPFVDTDTTDPQFFINNATLPRYVTGEGVKCFVVVQAPQNGLMTFNALCTMSYTNSAGVSGRTTNFVISSNTPVGSLCTLANQDRTIAPAAGTFAANFFVQLAPGDTGIRSIQSVQLDAGVGGLVSFVLCYPLTTINQFTSTTFTEKPFFSRTGEFGPKIEDGAFLQFLWHTNSASGAGTINAMLQFVWS